MDDLQQLTKLLTRRIVLFDVKTFPGQLVLQSLEVFEGASMAKMTLEAFVKFLIKLFKVCYRLKTH